MVTLTKYLGIDHKVYCNAGPQAKETFQTNLLEKFLEIIKPDQKRDEGSKPLKNRLLDVNGISFVRG